MLFSLIKLIRTGGGVTVNLLLLNHVVRLHMINNIVNEPEKIKFQDCFHFCWH